MKKVVILMCSLVIVFATMAMTSISYAQVIINFDTDTKGDPIAPGTVINNTYQIWGVTFTGTLDGNAYAGPSGLAASDPNTVSIYSDGGPFNAANGVIRATFSSAVNRVTLKAIPDDDDDPAGLIAYDAGGIQLDFDTTSGTSGVGNPEQLEVNADNIAYVEFAGLIVGPNFNMVCFDDLGFPTIMMIPTISEWGMIIFSLLILGSALWIIRQRQRIR